MNATSGSMHASSSRSSTKRGARTSQSRSQRNMPPLGGTNEKMGTSVPLLNATRLELSAPLMQTVEAGRRSKLEAMALHCKL